MRGGGGNFGVVTSFDFALHPMQREVIGGNIIFPLEQAKQVLRFYSEYAGAARGGDSRSARLCARRAADCDVRYPTEL